jgi:hypothetical protein
MRNPHNVHSYFVVQVRVFVFVPNTLVASMMPWQAAIYESAYAKARRESERNDFPSAENWN